MPEEQQTPEQQQPSNAGPVPAREVPQQRLPVNASHFRNGRITRQGMVQAIRNGGSVLHNGRHITRIEEIPTGADLADTPEERTAERQRLEQERERIDRELGTLKDADKPAKK